MASELIRLNVGGTEFVTTRTTLCLPESLFDKMFNRNMQPGIQINDAYFLDRDPGLFIHILNYLRNLERWICPSDASLLSGLVNEAEYFLLDGLLAKIRRRIRITDTFEVYCEMRGPIILRMSFAAAPDFIIKLFEKYIGNLNSEGGHPMYKLSGTIVGVVRVILSSYPEYELVANFMVPRHKHSLGDDLGQVDTLALVFRSKYASIVFDDIRARLERP